jgi:hypothetical protein
MAKTAALYDRDFVLWTEEQATQLRRCKNSNLPLDWENLAEEIESLGKSDRRGVASQLRRILRHLLKMEASPAAGPRAGCRSTILDARAEIEDILRDSPSLRRGIDAKIAEQLGSAAQLAEIDLSRDGEAIEKVRARLEQSGFTADEVLGDWFPEPRG